MKKTKIWFNRWFSTAYIYIDMIRNNLDGRKFEVYVTHSVKESVVLQNADHAEIEPLLIGKEYVDYCLEFCKKNEIDLFIPKYDMVSIAPHLKEFENIGTKVMVCSDMKLMETIDDKAKFYESVRPYNIINIPDYFVVDNVKDFKIAYESLIKKGHRVCFKPVIGIGGEGFRVIDDRDDTFESIFEPINHRISLKKSINLLGSKKKFKPLMVMEFLEGNEYSIDCLAYGGKLYAAVPRKKLMGRLEYIDGNSDLIKMARKFAEIYKLPYMFNLQFKMKNGVCKLLEINPRMSGGLYISALSGANFPYLAVKLALGEKIEVPMLKYDIMSTHLENSIVMKNIIYKDVKAIS